MGKIKLTIGGIFTALGLPFFLIGSGFYISDEMTASNGIRTTGTVISLSGGKPKPTIEYTDQSGKTHRFTSSTSVSPPPHQRGDKVGIIYDPENPSDAIIDSFWFRYFFPAIFGGMGGIFLTVGLGFLWSHRRRKQKIQELRSRGLRIEAEFLRCYLDRTVKVNRRSPYVVEAQGIHPATGKITLYKSERMWMDLSEALEGQKLPVLVDPNQPKLHYIDLSEWISEDSYA